MSRPLAALGWLCAAPLLLQGCLVSFNDYPLGDVDGASGAGSRSTSGTPAVLIGGGGGSTAMGGAGSNGRGGVPATSPSVAENMIDDFQDGDQAILEQQGRKGTWYVGNDGRGQQTPRSDQPLLPSPVEPARGKSTRGLHTFGGPFQLWGALVGTSLAENGAPYDLSGYSGLRLWVRAGSSAENIAKVVRLNVPTPDTNEGHGCDVCNDHLGADIPLSSQWTQVDIPLSSLEQNGYGRPLVTTPDLKNVTSLQLSFSGGVAFDLWVDDIELY